MTLEELLRLLEMCRANNVYTIDFGMAKVSFHRDVQPPAGPPKVARPLPPSSPVDVDLQSIEELEKRLMVPVQGSATNGR